MYHSTDTGETWNRATLPTKQPWEQQVSKQNLFTSFPPTQQNLTGWVLLTSEPTAGLMGKTLYQSTDSGKSWQFLADVSLTIDGYVTGVTFRDTQNGWITASQHGAVMLPLYRSKDGGNTWTLQTIDIPQNYKYGNVMPPKFDKTNLQNGTISIEFVNDSKRNIVEYKSQDGGDTWKP